MTDITLGQYIYGTSLIHRLDPRIKIVATIAMMVAIFLIQNFIGFAIAALFLCIIIMISKIPFRMVIRSLRPLMWILIFTFIINVLFTVEGTPIFELGFIHITVGGLQHGIKMSLRIMLLVMSSSLLTFTTTPMSMTDAIERLLAPLAKLRFPVHELAMIMTIALSMIPTLLEESNKIIKAQMARGADFDSGNILQRVKAMIPILIPLFVSSFRRADELAMAMESRCYHGGEGRTRMKVLHLQWIDLYAVLSIAVLFVFVFIWGR